MYAITDYDYDLPDGRIAQAPASPRDSSRLLCLNRAGGDISHRRFFELAEMLSPSDLLVVNNTRVVPAKLRGVKKTGGRVEALLLDYPGTKEAGTIRCRCLLKSSKQLKPGTAMIFEDTLAAEVIGFSDGIYTVQLDTADLATTLQAIGRVPLPPYIEKNRDNVSCDDTICYQTMYARENGAVAAPTAGLHFTENVFDSLKKLGVQVAPITLHVGHGTFLPVRVTDIRDHRMHAEIFSVSQETADAINQTRQQGGRIVAVGTTVVRVLEYLAKDTGSVTAGSGDCDLFIYPGFPFNMVNAMVTNFHLPQSTLLMLVAAFAGRERILDTYKTAIAENYCFYSYGDAMLIY